MVNLDVYTSIGCVTELLAQSKYHSPFAMSDYINNQVIPPILLNQSRLYLAEDLTAEAFVSWARLSQEVWDDISNSGRALQAHEWNSGKLLYFNDFIAPYGTARKVFKDLVINTFPNEKHALSLRRINGGMISKMNHWERRELQGFSKQGTGAA